MYSAHQHDPGNAPRSGRADFAAPTAERIESLDLLRGVAVLGILITNIQHFAMFSGTVRDPSLYGDLRGANFAVYAFTYVFALQKFLPIFAMLFGAGVALAAERFESRGIDPAPIHYRRMIILLIVGALHAYLIWYGDILFTYAVCGMVIYPLRGRSPRLLIALGLGALAVPLVLELVRYGVPPFEPPAVIGATITMQRRIVEDLATFRSGWLDQLAIRAPYAMQSQTSGLIFGLFWRAGGLMLIGMALIKLRVLTGARSSRFYSLLAISGLIAGLPVTIAGLAWGVSVDWDSPLVRFVSNEIIYWFGIPMSLSYLALIFLVWHYAGRGVSRRALRPFMAAGRLALTCYLLESVLCTLIFYGHGLGQYGSLERTQQLGIVAGVWIVLLIFVSVWARWFRFGPVEWLWRSLTYLKPIPILQASWSRR